MKIFLSALESREKTVMDEMIRKGETIEWVLMSYYAIMKKPRLMDKLRKLSNEILIDSGAYSFQNGKKVNWIDYTKSYADFIEENDDVKILGYFEMDVDSLLGYDNVLKLRRILEDKSDKIIPVWHKNRGIPEFKQMCKDYSGKIVAISAVGHKEVRKSQYSMFLKEAWKHDCKLHCLGMTSIPMLHEIPFDFVDSTSWLRYGCFGECIDFQNGVLTSQKVGTHYKYPFLDK